jgi:hypothetical protein
MKLKRNYDWRDHNLYIQDISTPSPSNIFLSKEEYPKLLANEIKLAPKGKVFFSNYHNNLKNNQ